MLRIYIQKNISKKKKKRNKIGSFVVMWMKLESYTAWRKPERAKWTLYVTHTHAYEIWKNGVGGHLCRAGTQTWRRHLWTQWGWGRRQRGESGKQRRGSTRPRARQPASGSLLQSARRWPRALWRPGRGAPGGGDTGMHTAGSLRPATKTSSAVKRSHPNLENAERWLFCWYRSGVVDVLNKLRFTGDEWGQWRAGKLGLTDTLYYRWNSAILGRVSWGGRNRSPPCVALHKTSSAPGWQFSIVCLHRPWDTRTYVRSWSWATKFAVICHSAMENTMSPSFVFLVNSELLESSIR